MAYEPAELADMIADESNTPTPHSLPSRLSCCVQPSNDSTTSCSGSTSTPHASTPSSPRRPANVLATVHRRLDHEVLLVDASLVRIEE
jgi:hypothetical protein